MWKMFKRTPKAERCFVCYPEQEDINQLCPFHENWLRRKRTRHER